MGEILQALNEAHLRQRVESRKNLLKSNKRELQKHWTDKEEKARDKFTESLEWRMMPVTLSVRSEDF